MLKKLILLLIVIAPMTIFAQEKIAYLNVNEVFMKMPEMKEVETKLATKSETIKKNLAAIEAELQALVEKFGKTPTDSLTESTILDRNNQVESLQKRYSDYSQNGMAEFEREQQALVAPLQQKMRETIKEVGDANNFLYILDASVILHVGSQAVDATGLVKTKLGIKD